MTRESIEGFRLSPQQERLWLLQQSGGSAAYNSACVIGIEGPLDPLRLKAALERVVEDNEILRTLFQSLPGMQTPLQVIGEASACWHEDADLSRLPAQEQAKALEAIFKEMARGEFDFERGPMLQARLARLADERHALVVVAPALCADGVALNNLLIETSRAYGLDDRAAGDERAQYADFSGLLNDLLESEETELGRQHWRKKSFPDPFALQLPLEQERAARKSFDPQRLSVSTGIALARRIEAVCKERGVAPSAFLLACWQALLARLSSQYDFTIGVSCDGRTYDDLKDAIGLFSKLLPFNIALDESGAFARVLQQVDEASREIYEWQEYFDWEQLQQAQGNAGAAQYFPFCFSFEPEAASESSGGVKFSMAEKQSCSDRFKIMLSCRSGECGFVLEFHYDSSAFAQASIGRLAARYGKLLESASRHVDQALADLEILSDDERRLLVYDFNDTGADYRNDRTISEWIEAQAERAPGNVAVIFEGERLTYGELDRRANRLANHLVRLGAKTESLVAVCMERSLEMVVGLLGIMKAGAAYVPLDPGYPKDRLDYMLADAGASMLLTERQLAEMFSDRAGQVVCLDDCAEHLAQESDARPQAKATADNLAYVIYTSGSTGRPKGVQITHRAICNRLLWMQSAFPIGEADKVIQKTPFSFDASVWELFLPLMTGAQLVLARPQGHKDSSYLASLIAQEGVTILQLVPSMLQVALEEPAIERCSSLRRVYCGGEALPGELQQRLFERLDVELINLYGPTEVSIDASFWRCERGSSYAVVPIGNPIGNAQIYILDSRLRPTPIGVPGELHISGAGLARGYLNQPAITAEKFIPNPFAPASGARLYKSGDLARYKADGTIEFLGRLDHQVKVRGFRIELGEIEAALNQHPSLREAAVLAVEAAAGDKRLAAYVVAKQGQQVAADQLRSFLAERLPDFMIPSTFAVLEAMPLTPNGKLDRMALAATQHQVLQDGDKTSLAPRTPVEEILAAIWADVLSAEHMSTHDDFFKSGGHSLLATQAVSRMREAFQIELPLRKIFEAPTVASLAAVIESELRAGRGLDSGPILPVARGGALPLSYAQQRLWFLDQLEPGSPIYNIPVAVKLSGTLDIAAFKRSINEVVRRHESLRTSFQSIAGQPMQVIAPAQQVQVQMQDLSELDYQQALEQAVLIANQEAQKGFDLSEGPLLRVMLLKLSEQEHVLVMVMHHIISDGWSSGILVREIAELYESYKRGEEPRLEELKVQYGDFAQWQREWLSGEVLERQMQYWREQLKGAPSVLELRTDRARPAVQTYRGATESFTVREEVYEQMKRLSRREGVTIFMSLLAAFDVLLHRYSGATDIVVGTDVANRNRIETEGLIGFFVNQLVLRTDLSGDPTFIELLGRVRDVTLNAYTFQDVPFEMLVESLKPERSLSHAPLFQVKFLLQTAPDLPEGLAALNLSSLEIERKTAQFDLIFNLIETDRELIGQADYSTDLFDASTIRNMLRHYERLLEQIVADPQQRLSGLRLLSEAETNGFSPSDFPDADLSLSDFENLVLELNKGS